MIGRKREAMDRRHDQPGALDGRPIAGHNVLRVGFGECRWAPVADSRRLTKASAASRVPDQLILVDARSGAV